jgi:PAS domain S-box-containing protein
MDNFLDTQPIQQSDEQQPHNPREFSKKTFSKTNTRQLLSKREGAAWDLLDVMAEMVILVDRQGNILWVNQTASKRLDKSMEVLVGVSIWDVYPSQKTTHYKTLFNKVIKTGHSLNFIDKDDTHWVEFSIYPINFRNGKPEDIAFLSRDITAQIDAEEALKRVSLQLISAQEDERHRISQELHDEIGQQMTALLLELHSVQAALSKEHAPFAYNIEELIRDLEEIMKRLRQVFYQLSPPFLDNTALIKVLSAHCSSFTKSTGIPIDISCPDDFPTLSNIYEVTLYRFVQEGLTNAAKHGKASAVWINLDASGNEINISLEDDGLGFDPISLLPGLGIKGIQERFMMLKGSFEIESSPGKGTKIFGSLPIIPDKS